MTIVRTVQYLVIANALFLVFQSVRVISIYSAVYTLTKGKKRQLPLHVWLIAVSYMIYVLATTYFLYVNGAEQQSLSRAIFYGVAGIIGQVALWNVLSYERRRYSEVTNVTDEDAVEELEP